MKRLLAFIVVVAFLNALGSMMLSARDTSATPAKRPVPPSC